MGAIEHKGGKPLQRLTESEKQARDQEFFKKTADYYIQGAKFSGSGTNERDLKTLYEIYNNQIPLRYFDHVTNPLNTDKDEYKNWPAKIRPTTILRTNLDQLMSEYPKRPFYSYVSNLGDDAYNAFTESLNKVLNDTLQRHFIKMAETALAEQGLSMGEEAQQIAQQEIPTPDEVATSYKANYKDKLAIKGQKRLNRLIVESEARRLWQKMFKDWVIAGEPRSYKGVHNSKFIYKHVSPLNIDHDRSEGLDFIEDGEWVVARYPMTYSDIVDEFYEDLKEKDHKVLEEGARFAKPKAFYDHIKGLSTDSADDTGKEIVYHVCWKGKKMIKKVTSIDPLTGEELVDWFDEVYVPTPDEKVEEVWVNCVYQAYRVGDLYLRCGEIPNQRNEMNNHSSCKLPYNGKNFSDTHAKNISLVEIGLPFQIMYIIVTRALEMTIAKSKGKIVLLDKNVIPNKDGWDEDKFFYYAEALGYGLIDRSKMGVDKSFNQYQVLDLTLFDSIKQLIELQTHIKNEWDDVLGFSRQRKGQTYATDKVGANSEALFQSTVITDMIFIGFEEFVERELQGMLDLTKFIDIDGVRKLYNESEVDYQLLEIDPEEYISADLGVFVTKQEIEKLRKMEAFAQQFAINGASPSTVLELVTADNLANLKAVLKKTEDAQAQAMQAQSENEAQLQRELEDMRMQYMQIEKQLDEQFMNAEYNRKEAIEHIKGEYSLHRNLEGNDGDNNDNGIPDSQEIFDRTQQRSEMVATINKENQDRLMEDRHKRQEADLKRKEIDQKDKDSRRKAEIELIKQKNEDRRTALTLADKERDRQSKERIEKLKAKTALKNKVAGEKPSNSK